MQMTFNEYNHIDNNYKFFEWNLVKEVIANETIEYVALEKIHGTNFSFIAAETVDANIEINPCRRGDILKPTEKFFSSDTICARYSDDVKKVFQETKTLIENKLQKTIKQIQLYGELYGGLYPGTEKVKNAKLVQKGIYYSNTNEFSAFDIKYTLEDASSYFLDWNEFEQIMSLTSIHIVPVLCKGTWENVTSLSTLFASVVHETFSLPKLEENYAEGYIIKPIKEIQLDKEHRFICKCKNPLFSEIVKNDKTSLKIKETSTTTINPYADRLDTYVNENRYDNVKTKIVENTPVNQLVEMFHNDVWTDFIDDLNTDSIVLNAAETRELKKRLNVLANKYVRSRYH